jgi:predicted nucleic acid-binding protein
MVLVDTSVWIRALSNRAPFAEELGRLLGLDEVAGHAMVYGELLIGDVGGRKKLLSDYKRMVQAATVPHAEVVAFVERRHLHGRGAGWIDVSLLASAIVSGLKLWTADPRLSAMANEFGVDHQVPITRSDPTSNQQPATNN